MEDKTESTLIKKGLTCEVCQKDNMSLYSDGHTYCFSGGCGHRGHMDLEGQTPLKPSAASSPRMPSDFLKGSVPDLGFKKRGLTPQTLAKAGVFEAGYKGEKVHVYPYYDKKGNLANQKTRGAGKEFSVVKGEDAPEITKCQLFMQPLYGEKFDRQVIITEGELDALSVAQAMDWKVAVVSINAGAHHAAKCLKENYLWVDRFEDIVLWMDNDADGIAAAQECAALFKVGKVRIAKAPEGYKDASDLLQDSLPGDIKAAVYAASKWQPAGIVNAADNPEDVKKPKEEDHAFSFEWPWPQLTAYLGPILPGQVIFNVSGTGVGKTTFLYHTLESLVAQGAKVGFFSFEGTRREIKLGILTVVNGKRLDLEPLSDDEMGALHDKFFGSRQIEMFDPETAEWNLAALEGYMRYCAKALDCQILVIDPLSFMVAGMDPNADERKGLDNVSMKIAAMAKELGIHTQLGHHLSRPQGLGHEEGAPTSISQLRGSGGIGFFATTIIGHERNQQADGDDALITQLRALKNRPRSRTGVIMALAYDLETGRLAPTSKPFPKPGPGKAADSQHKGFAPVGEGDY